MISRTPATLPSSVSRSIRTAPMVLAAAPSEMKITEKPATKASDAKNTWRPAAGDAAGPVPAAVLRIESSDTPEMNDR